MTNKGFNYQIRYKAMCEYYTAGESQVTDEQRQALQAGKEIAHTQHIVTDYAKKRVTTILEIWAMIRRINDTQVNSWFANNICFLTLTLPEETTIDSKTMYRKCLYPFIRQLERKQNLNFYLWKLEVQENGRFHYHLIIGNLIEKNYLRTEWNKWLNKVGLVDMYSQKMQERHKDGMNYSDEMVRKYGKDKLVGWYIYGTATGWKNPRTIDIQEINDHEQLVTYVNKYVGKALHENVGVCRVWGCSDKLRNVVFPTIHVSKKSHNKFRRMIENCNNTHVINSFSTYYKYTGDFCKQYMTNKDYQQYRNKVLDMAIHFV